MSLTADPAATHVARELKYARPLINCRFDPSGQFVFAATEDNSVQRWDLATGEKTALVAHASWVRPLAFDPTGQTLLTGGYDGQLMWWTATVPSPQVITTVSAHQGWIRAAAVSPDGKLVATAGNDLIVRLWNMSDGSPAGEFSGHAKHVYSVWFHPDGQYLLSGDLAGVVRQWDIAAAKEIRSFDASILHTYNGGQGVDYGGVRSLCLSPDGKRLACSGLTNASNPLGAVNEPLVVVFDWTSGEKLIDHETKDKLKGIAWRALYHPEGFLIVASGGSGGGFLLFWKPEEKHAFFQLKLPNTAREMDLHPDGIQIATAHHDGILRISKMHPKAAEGEAKK